MRCFICGGIGHHVAEFNSAGLKCFKCGKQGHHSAECKCNVMNCYNCGELGHISTQCQKPRKAPNYVQHNGRVFSLSGVNILRSEIWFEIRVSLMVFLWLLWLILASLDYVNKLKLEVLSMIISMVIDTPTNGLMTTPLACLNFPLTIYGKDFGVDLICFPFVMAIKIPERTKARNNNKVATNVYFF